MQLDLSALSTNLAIYRIRAGKSQAEVAAEAGMSRVGYRAIETGAATPRVDSLVRIAQALGVRPDDLLTPQRSLRAVRFRALKKMTSRTQVLAEVAAWLADYNGLEEMLGAKAPLKFQNVDGRIDRSLGPDDRAKQAAYLARQDVGLDAHDLIRDPSGLLEDNGVKVITPSIAAEGFFGLSVHESDGGPAVVVNVWERISVERWIFTALHELGHLLLHADAFDVTESAEVKSEERQADIFASHFLMPELLFDKEWDEARGLPLVERVFKIKRLFHVSYRTVLYRIAERSERPRDVWIRFQMEYKKRSGHTLRRTDEPKPLAPDDFGAGRPGDRSADEPERLAPSDFVRDRLSRLVRMGLERKVINAEGAAKILRIDRDTMQHRMDSWID